MTQQADRADLAPELNRSLLGARLLIGLAQGGALLALYRSALSHIWPSTDALIFDPLFIAAVFVPLVVMTAIGTMRADACTIWTMATAALCAGLGFYTAYRDPPGTFSPAWSQLVLTCLGLAMTLFIGQSLVTASSTERRLFASYPRYHDIAWKLALQLMLAVLFTAVFWALLLLGAQLFRLIKIEFFFDLISHDWFWIPATTLVAAGALHLTDVRAGVVRGVRTLILSVLSWLLPIMVVIAAAFVMALPFTGLTPLWDTRRATNILLAAIAALVLLINCAYQDGRIETKPPAVLLYFRVAAALLLVPLAGLAAIGLGLRVDQYGWSPQRVIAAAGVAIAACYSFGYVASLFRFGLTLRGIELTNITTAVVISVLLLALLSPIADPARISVANQVQRLESGRVSPDQFDFAFLHFSSGRYGVEALERLSHKQDGAEAARIASKAREELDRRSRIVIGNRTPASASTRRANIAVVSPAGETLPDEFLTRDWNSFSRPWQLPQCLIAPGATCDAILLDLDGNGTREILLFSSNPPIGNATLFHPSSDGWTVAGTVLSTNCPGVREALKMGQFELVSGPRDIVANGTRLRVAFECMSNAAPPSAPAGSRK